MGAAVIRWGFTAMFRLLGWRLLQTVILVGGALLCANLPLASAYAETARLLAVEYSASASSKPEKFEGCAISYLARIQTSGGEQFLVLGSINSLYVRDRAPGVGITVNAGRFEDSKFEPIELSHAEVSFSSGDNTSKFKQVPGDGPFSRILTRVEYEGAQDWQLIITRIYEGFRISVSGPALDVTFELPRFSKEESAAHKKFLDCQWAAMTKFEEWLDSARTKK